MKLIIAEKNNVSKQLRNALDPQAKYIQTSQYCGYYIGEDFIFCSALGHLFELTPPGEINPDYKKWDLNNLPYLLPEVMPLKPNNVDKAYFKTIKELYNRSDITEVIVATDPDREGQNIYEKIKRNLKVKNVKETRIWIKEWTPEGLKEAYTNRKDNSDYNGLKIAGEAREEGDAIIGIQGTVAMSKKFGGYKEIYTVGRVQTPTLKFCYDREMEIQNFKPEPYSIISLKIASDSPSEAIVLKHKANRLSKDAISKLSSELKKIKTIPVSVIKKRISLACPKLYTTTEIQKDMNKLYKFSPDKTLDILQSLYQTYSLTTYPRTDKNVISASTAKVALNAIKNVQTAGLFDNEISIVLNNHYPISSSVVSTLDLPHEAITPVFGSINLSVIKSLSADEQRVYSAILSRFIQAFFPNAEFDETSVNTTISINSQLEEFETKGKINTNIGWMILSPRNNESKIPPITDGKSYPILDILTEDKVTTPPSRYSEAGLLDAMEHANRFVSNKQDSAILKDIAGIGTGATRASIIKGLKDREYLTLTKGVLIPTPKAFSLFKYLPESNLSSPIQTAKLEKMLGEIIDGIKTKEEFMSEIKEQNAELIEKIKSYSGEITTATKETFGKCPICGRQIIKNAKSYCCENWKNGCKFTIWNPSFNKTITPKMLAEILKGKTSLLTFKYGENKDYKARLYLDENYKLTREYENSNKMLTSVSSTDFGTCPNCGKQIIETDKAYGCSGYRDGCQTTIWKSALSKLGKPKINKTEAKKLLNGATIVVKLISKAGKPYEAKAYFEHSENMVKVLFR